MPNPTLRGSFCGCCQGCYNHWVMREMCTILRNNSTLLEMLRTPLGAFLDAPQTGLPKHVDGER